MIDDDDIERALDYLRDNAEEAAKAKAERIYVEEYRKVIKANLMKEHGELSAALQEREAYADDRYARHLDAIREAVMIDEKHRFLRAAAEAKISAWQTFSANHRGMKI
jgi:hypothetical protein